MLEIMYLLLDSKGGQVSQDSSITKIGVGDRETGNTGHSWGCGGIAPIEKIENRRYKVLNGYVRQLSIKYQNILRIRSTNSSKKLKNSDIAKEQRLSVHYINEILKDCYEILRNNLKNTPKVV